MYMYLIVRTSFTLSHINNILVHVQVEYIVHKHQTTYGLTTISGRYYLPGLKCYSEYIVNREFQQNCRQTYMYVCIYT